MLSLMVGGKGEMLAFLRENCARQRLCHDPPISYAIEHADPLVIADYWPARAL
jgi:hypothetical protein